MIEIFSLHKTNVSHVRYVWDVNYIYLNVTDL